MPRSSSLVATFVFLAACGAGAPRGATPTAEDPGLAAALAVVRAAECEAAVEERILDRLTHWTDDVELIFERLPDEPHTATTLRGAAARAYGSQPSLRPLGPGGPGTCVIVDDLETIVRARRELDLDTLAASIVGGTGSNPLGAFAVKRRTMQLTATRVDASTIDVTFGRFDEPESVVVEGRARLVLDALRRWRIVRVSERRVEQVPPVVPRLRFDAAHFAPADDVVDRARASGDAACLLSALHDAGRGGEAFDLLLASQSLVTRHPWLAMQIGLETGRLPELRARHAEALTEERLGAAFFGAEERSAVCAGVYPPELGREVGAARVPAFRACTPTDEERLRTGGLPEGDACAPAPERLRAFLDAWVTRFGECRGGSDETVTVTFFVDGGGALLTAASPDDATSACVRQAFEGHPFPRFRLRPAPPPPAVPFQELFARIQHARAAAHPVDPAEEAWQDELAIDEPPLELEPDVGPAWRVELRVQLGPTPTYGPVARVTRSGSP